MKKFLLQLLLIIPILSVSILTIYAETWETDTITPPIILCSLQYEIIWPEQVKVDTTHEYKLTLTGTGEGFSWAVTYRLKRDSKIVEMMQDREKYLRYFTTPWEVTLEATIENKLNQKICEWVVSKKIRVYKTILTYLWVERQWIETGIKDIFEKNDILYKWYNTNISISKLEDLQDIWTSIDQSDVFVIGNKDILGVFSDIVKLQKTKPLIFAKKKVFIISDYSRSFLSKVLASSLSQLGATKASVISEDQYYWLLTRASSGDTELLLGQELSYEKSNTVYSLSKFLEFLAYAGFSYQLLAFLLSLTVVVLILNILKQIVWFNVFGIYYPVLFAITISILGLSAFIFIFIGFLSIVIVNLFSKKVHLLLHAKRSLLISLYIVLFLFTLGVDNFFELSFINYGIFDNPFIIFPLFIMIILSDKVFQEDIDMFGKSAFFDIAQYGIITYVIYWLIEYKTLQYFLISYPDSIILVVFLNIFIGRYMGLQLFEYFRFSPLLRKINEEE